MKPKEHRDPVTVKIKDGKVEILFPNEAVVRIDDQLARDLGETLYRFGWDLRTARENSQKSV